MLSLNQKREIEKYKKLYESNKGFKCPYFNNEEVIFNKKGFNHLLRKAGRPRPFLDQRRRLMLLKYCNEILSGNYLKVEIRAGKKDNETTFWCFDSCIADKNIRLIVRQIGRGKKLFFDIFPLKH